MIPVLHKKPGPFRDQQRSMTGEIFYPRIERIFTYGEQLRRRCLFSVLFVLIRKIRGSNFHRLAIRAGLALPGILHFHTCCKAKKRTWGRHDMHHSRMAVVAVWRDQTQSSADRFQPQ